MEQNLEYIISYPQINPGSDKTHIYFFEGTSLSSLSNFFINDGNSVNATAKVANSDEDSTCTDTANEEKNSKTKRLFVTDTTISNLPSLKPFIESFSCNKSEDNVLLILPSGEKYKTVDSVLQIVKTAIENNFNRKDIFVGIGGGVITDMTAFASSIFKRGAKFEAVPTTLLAMVDAAIGGKTGCDFENYKNMIGSFYPAQKLYIFPEFIQSLSEEQYLSGFAEAFKTALLYSAPMYELIKNNREKILKRDSKVLFEIIYNCVKAKAKIVQEDFTEKNIRMQLNLGHTFAHALETNAGLGNVTHGEAVAWGIARALCLSENLKLCKTEYKEEVLSLLKCFGYETQNIHSTTNNIDKISEKLLSAMKKDKKNSSNKIRVILQKGLENTVITEVSDSEILKIL